MKNSYLFFCIFLFASCRDRHELSYSLSKDSILFSKINFNDTLKSQVYVLNHSMKVIRILDIEAGCGCTTAILSDSIIQKGDSVKINISYVPKKVNDSGKVTKYITLRLDNVPVFKNIVIKGEVIK
jgi:Protein of unknown function (DUF1573)